MARVVATTILTAAMTAAVTAALVCGLSDPGADRAPFGDGDRANPAVWRALEARVRELERRPEPAVAPVPAPQRTPLAEPDAAALTARLDALERRLDGGAGRAVRDRTDAARRRAMAATTSTPGGDEDDAAGARDVLTDPRSTDIERSFAHLGLRHDADAYTPEVVRDLARIGATHADPEVRARIWTAFDGAARVPQIVPDLLRAVHADSDAGVRTEAAETLANYLDEPGVEDALRHVVAHDADQRVRERALRELRARGVVR